MTIPDHPAGATYDVICEVVRFRMAIETAPPGAIPSQLREAIIREVRSFTASLIQHAKEHQS